MPTLDWLNRAAAFTLAAKVPYRLLEQMSVHHAKLPDLPPRPLGEGRGEGSPPPPLPATDNLLIQGDNLEALKALLPFTAARSNAFLSTHPTTPKARSSTTTTTSNTRNG